MAMILIYWFENAALGTQILQQLAVQIRAALCSPDFQHLSEFSFQRRFLQACLERSYSVVAQYHKHVKAGLASPFFCGESVTLELCTNTLVHFHTCARARARACVCVCVCMHVCSMYACIYVCMCMYVCLFVCICLYVFVCLFVCLFASVYTYVCMYLCM